MNCNFINLFYLPLENNEGKVSGSIYLGSIKDNLGFYSYHRNSDLVARTVKNIGRTILHLTKAPSMGHSVSNQGQNEFLEEYKKQNDQAVILQIFSHALLIEQSLYERKILCLYLTAFAGYFFHKFV